MPVEAWLTTSQLSMHYLDWGGAGSPVIALHGLASSAHWYDLVMPHLTDSFHIFALDQRAHGKTDQPPAGYDWETLANDVAEAMDQLGIEHAPVVGHSWGANVALGLATLHPKRVSKLVLVEGGFFSFNRSEITWEQFKTRLSPRDIYGPRALTQKVREDGRIVNVSVVVATAVNGEGKREIIGMDVGTSEDGAFWLAFLRSLSARGLSGVELVVSDAHQGLRGAIAAVFGGASWQRCRTHFMTNLLTRVPRRVQPWMGTMVRTIYQQPSPDEIHAQLDRVTDQLGDRFPQVASLLDEAGPDILAFSSFPVAH